MTTRARASSAGAERTPRWQHGRTVLAATVRVGRGRIAAFTDSTVWSSFAVFSHDREKLAMDLVRLLNREPSPYELPIRGLAVAAGADRRVRGAERWCGSGLALPAILCRATRPLVGRRAVGGPAPLALRLAEAECSGLRGHVSLAGGRLRVPPGARDARLHAGRPELRHAARLRPAPGAGAAGRFHLRQGPVHARDAGHIRDRPGEFPARRRRWRASRTLFAGAVA